MMRKIIKRILCPILSVVMLSSTIFGCASLILDNERNNAQVVAQINPITFTYEQNGEQKTWTSEKKLIFKRDLVLVMNANFQTWYEQNQGTVAEAAEYFINQLVNKELYLIQAQNLVTQGRMKIRLGENGEAANDLNTINKELYTVFDTQIRSIANELRLLNDEETIEYTEGGDAPSTTFPIYSEPKTIQQIEQDEKEADVDDFEIWAPSLSRAPSLTDYAEQEGLKRLCDTIASNAISDLEATISSLKIVKGREYKALVKDRISELEDLLTIVEDEYKQWSQWLSRPETVHEAYFNLGSSQTVRYILGKDKIDQLKISKVEETIKKEVTVSDSEIQAEYYNRLNEQMERYKNITTFVADITNTESPVQILYYPNNDYFYVRHILIGFTEEQKSRLSAYKADPNRSAQEKAAFRVQLAKEIVAYPHKNGENDLSRPMTAQLVYNEVASVMGQLKGNAVDANREFIKLIYKYNTDPGIFSSEKGYVVGPKAASIEEETYVIEFATSARELKANYDANRNEIGAISGLVLTDHGYHILFLAEVPSARSSVGLMDYTAPIMVDRIYYSIRKSLLESKGITAVSLWTEQNITNQASELASSVTYFKDRYEDIK